MARKKNKANHSNDILKWISNFQAPWLLEYQGKGITRLVVLLFSMMIVLIFLSNHVERKRKYLSQTQNEVERLRSQYLRAHSDYERHASPQLVKQKTKQLGFEPLKEPVKLVEYYREDYRTNKETE